MRKSESFGGSSMEGDGTLGTEGYELSMKIFIEKQNVSTN